MEFIFIAKLEPVLSQNVVAKDAAKRCPVDSEWKLAAKEHEQYKNYEVVLLSKQNGKWLGLSVKEVNNLFDIVLYNNKR